VITMKIAVFGYMTSYCLVDFKRHFLGIFCLHFENLLWLCVHTVRFERYHSVSNMVVLIQGCFIVARSKKSRKIFLFLCVCLCVFFACGGIVDDQLHDGKKYFFLLFS
jgi:hypothetical protein